MRGEIRLLPHNPDSAILGSVERVALTAGESTPASDAVTQWARISGRRPHKKFLLLRFEGVDTADAADRLVGRGLAVPRDQLPDLPAGEVYQRDLIGCRVETEAGEPIGEIAEIMATGSNDVLVVRGERGEHLIPYIDDVVVGFDSETSIIRIRVLPGLLQDD